MSLDLKTLDERTMIPALLRNSPQVRPVLDRYGLRGCGGPLGPVESLGFFAKAHDVPIDELLREVRAAAVTPSVASGVGEHAPTEQLGDTIYRPFFKSGMAVMLTLGATWGAYLLLRIGLGGSFRAVGIHEVNAHGHAQIFGWVGLFVMGFAYQAFPRFKHTSLAFPRLAYATWWMMLTGVVARSLMEPFAASARWQIAPAVAASALEVLAIALFIWIVSATWRASGKPLAFYDYYIVSALGWFFIQAIYDAYYFAATLNAAGREELLDLVATWQGPLRGMQIHGFALLMILGVSQRIFHHFYDLPAPSQRISRAALWMLNVAIDGEVLGLILMRTAGHAWAALWYSSVLLLAGTVAMLVWNWRIFSRATDVDRSLKFLRTAYVWLFISLGMLVLVPAYQFGLLRLLAPASDAVQIGFSHAYYGAIRHAITVGFISLMIVGVSSKVVPTLNGVDVRALPSLWAPYFLLNAGCGLRVFGQITTDFVPETFPITGFSGLLEVAGLAVWATHLWLIMAGRARVRNIAEIAESANIRLRPGSPILAVHRVGEVLELYPTLLDTFLRFGFTPLANPFLRKTLARHVTLEQACRRLDVDSQQLLEALNAARGADEVDKCGEPAEHEVFSG